MRAPLLLSCLLLTYAVSTARCVHVSVTLELFAEFAARARSDVVLLVDRSTSVGLLPYHLQTLPFVHGLLRDHLTNSRAALVAFNGDAVVLHDEVTPANGGDLRASRCALLSAERPAYEPRRRTRIADSLRIADRILTSARGARSPRGQAILLISDAAYREGVDESPHLWAQIVKGRGDVRLYVIQVGVWAEANRLRLLASDARHYDVIEKWRHLGRVSITSYVNDGKCDQPQFSN